MPHRLTARALAPGEWPDSRAEHRSYWRARPGAERVAAGRELHRRICSWFHLKGAPISAALRAAKPRE